MMEKFNVFTETLYGDIVCCGELQKKALIISKSQGYG
jgi:hypothetical protein